MEGGGGRGGIGSKKSQPQARAQAQRTHTSVERALLSLEPPPPPQPPTPCTQAHPQPTSTPTAPPHLGRQPRVQRVQEGRKHGRGPVARQAPSAAPAASGATEHRRRARAVGDRGLAGGGGVADRCLAGASAVERLGTLQHVLQRTCEHPSPTEDMHAHSHDDTKAHGNSNDLHNTQPRQRSTQTTHTQPGSRLHTEPTHKAPRRTRPPGLGRPGTTGSPRWMQW